MSRFLNKSRVHGTKEMRIHILGHSPHPEVLHIVKTTCFKKGLSYITTTPSHPRYLRCCRCSRQKSTRMETRFIGAGGIDSRDSTSADQGDIEELRIAVRGFRVHFEEGGDGFRFVGRTSAMKLGERREMLVWEVGRVSLEICGLQRCGLQRYNRWRIVNSDVYSAHG
ncbi:hypothetical protein P152DRAFT_289732 [Eremomyces bilateralis CBS 781.70]|uniref:Uncharacterized protein n=1 Tax=Eremomyces bilateralis CBS 781.70 TaxID=1392243 RepID=A0A6G1G6S1_9PEZI|nr:uncharacterized protein P152DRAFT_289732 [Eremomyces bilateralis CBS 781.70]KAF1813724.1 hypothetical protein P152DRAFT_289732 [Eremomyces bilateralis CBS 781.70]